jgi:hypothetical protein
MLMGETKENGRAAKTSGGPFRGERGMAEFRDGATLFLEREEQDDGSFPAVSPLKIPTAP